MPTFLSENMVFIHVPKTGGTWITQAVIAAGVSVRGPDPLGDQSYSEHGHAVLGEIAAGDRLSVAFVRHPLDWWRSYWGHRMRAGWDERNAVDATAASSDFNDFIVRALDGGHVGYYDALIAHFIGHPDPAIDFVGRFEYLAEDTMQALELSGESFSREALLAHPLENGNDYERFPARYEPEVAERLAQAEAQTIERFYPHEPVPSPLLLDGSSDGSASAANSGRLDESRLRSRVEGLERALERARRAQMELAAETEISHAELAAARGALAQLRSSRLLRYTRSLRVVSARARAAFSAPPNPRR